LENKVKDISANQRPERPCRILNGSEKQPFLRTSKETFLESSGEKYLGQSSWISNRFKKIHFVRTPKGTTFGKFGCWACSGSEEVGNVKGLQHTGGLTERQMAARHFFNQKSSAENVYGPSTILQKTALKLDEK